MKNKLLAILIALTALILFPKYVAAQDTTAFTVFPSIQDINVNPGERTRTQIQFRNNSDQLMLGDVKVADFIVTDKNGKTEIVEGQQMKPKYSASSWITLSDNSIAIPANEIVTVNLYINPPPVLTSCGYYALVYFQPTPEKLQRLGGANGSVSSITEKIGGLLDFIVQNRQCKESLFINQFQLPSFLEYGPIPLTMDIANTGDIHLQPEGYATLTNMIDTYVDQQNLKDSRIFPETAKTYDLSLGHKWMFGRYKVALTASYGTKHQTLSQVEYVWVIPWKVILVILLALIIVVLMGHNLYGKLITKGETMEKEIEVEKEEISKLREALRKRKD